MVFVACDDLLGWGGNGIDHLFYCMKYMYLEEGNLSEIEKILIHPFMGHFDQTSTCLKDNRGQ